MFGHFTQAVQRRLASLNLTISDQQVREFSWLAGGQLVSLLLSLVTVKLVTSIGPAGYGKFILATSIGGMLSLALFGPLEQGYIRMYFYYGQDGKTRKIFFDSLLRVLSISSGVLLFCGAVFILIGHTLYGLEVPFHAAAAIMILIAVLNIPINGMMNAMRMRKEGSMIQVGERLVIIVALGGTYLLWSLDATGVVLCMTFATSLSLIVRYVIYQNMSTKGSQTGQTSPPPDANAIRKEIYSRIAQYVQPFIAWGVVSWVQSNGERWVIDSVMTKADVGRYGLAFSLVNSSAVMLVNVLGQFVTPIIFAKYSSPDPAEQEKGKSLIRLNTWVTLMIFVAFAVILYFAGEQIIHLVSTRAFAMDGTVLFLLTMSLGMFYCGQAMTNIGLALNKPETYLRPKIIAAVLSAPMFYAGCTWNGVAGVVTAMVAVHSVYMLLIYNANRKLVLQQPEIGAPA